MDIAEYFQEFPQPNSPRLKPVAVSPVAGAIVERSALEFRWQMPASATAFELVIWKGADIVYASGVRPPPGLRRAMFRHDINTCAFTPELYANMLLPGVEYTWKVYVFTPTASALGSPAAPQHGMTRGGVINPANSSEEQKFKVTPTLGKHAGSFNIEVKLAYFTPDGAARTVFLEAHTNAAFAGVPAARTICQMDANRPANLTATLFGLDSKQDYYVCAYVRSNPGDGTPQDPGDGIALRQSTDPWGYVCAPERDGMRYEPMRITETLPAPTYRLPMYATDTNNNRTADIME